MRQHEERANLHQRVRSEIKQNCSDAQVRRRRERHQNVSRMRDRRIRQHPLHVRLHQRREIPDAHRQHGRDPNRPEPQIARRAECHIKNPHHHRERRHLRSRREQRRHRCRRTLIHVRRINLKWRRYHLESEAHEHQPESQNRKCRPEAWFEMLPESHQCAWCPSRRTSSRCRKEKMPSQKIPEENISAKLRSTRVRAAGIPQECRSRSSSSPGR